VLLARRGNFLGEFFATRENLIISTRRKVGRSSRIESDLFVIGD
jgi:hypothetical protein